MLALLEVEENLVVPAISTFEVFKRVLREHSEAQAIQAAAVMQRGLVVDLNSRFVIAAAQLSHALRLPMADSIFLATPRSLQASLYTLDADLKDLHDVELIQRP